MAVTKDSVQQLYIAYYGRPADQAGLDYWTNRANAEGLNAVVNAFGNSEEATNLYGKLSTEARVNKLYQNMFGRDADVEGLNFYVGKVLDGTYTLATLAKHILDGVNPNVPESKADGDALAQKLAAANAFTQALDTTAEILKYDEASEVTQGVAFLAGITAATTDTEINSMVDAATAALVGSDAVAKTFTLTAGSDNLTGTAGNDTFEAGVAATSTGGLVDTLQGVDQLNGGAGIDTLNATLSGAGLVSPTLSGIENVNVRVTTATGGLNLVGATGVTSVTVAKSTAAANVQNTGAAALGVANQNTAVTFGGSTATALTLNLDTVGTAATDIAIDLGTTTKNAATSFVINAKDAHVTFTEAVAGADTTSASVAATGANEITFAGTDLASLKTLTVTGAGSADFTGGALSALTTLTAGDGGVKVTGTSAAATALTATTGAGADTLVFNGANVKSITTGAGNDAVTLNTGALAATATVALGDGDDTVTLSGAAPSAGATIDGGAGTDTFATTVGFYNAISGYTAAQRALISNFEVLSITDTLANGATVDISSLTGIGSFTAAAGVAAGGNATVNKLGAAATVTIAGNNTAVTAAVSEVQNVAVTGTATGAVTFLGTAVAASANADTAAITVTKIVADKAALIAAWNAANPTLEIQDLAAGTGTSIDITYKNTEGNVAALTGTASAGITFALATETTAGALVGAAGSLTANLATDTSADAVTLVLNNNYTDNNDTTADARAVSNKFVVADVESLTVNSTGKISPAIVTKVDGYKADVLTNTLDLTGSNKLTSITVTGDQKLTLATTAAMTKLATIDASANTAGVTIDASLAASTSPALTIKGTAKADVITGGALGDTITLGAGNDTVVYSVAGSVSKIGTGKFDTITDFAANTYGNSVVTLGAAGTGASADTTKWTGDVLKFSADVQGVAGGVVVDKFTSAADATTFLANNAGSAAGLVAALDSTNNNLYVDNTNDGVADFFIHLTGVTTIDAAAFVLV